MSSLLGETLVRNGAITTEELESALQAQRQHGGHLGTNLLELEMLGERELGDALADSLRARYAPPEIVEEVKPEAVRHLPRWLALKHKAVPLTLQDDHLQLLVASPRQLAGLSTRTGLRLTPWVAPWVRVREALHRTYGIPLDDRDARVLEGLAPTPVDQVLERRMHLSENGKRAITTVLDAFSSRLEHVVLFRVKEGVATVWDVRGPELDRRELSGLEMPARSGSLLELLSIYDTYAGPVPGEEACQVFFKCLGIPVPREMFLSPIRVGRSDAAILYADGGAEANVHPQSGNLIGLARKLTLALTALAVHGQRVRLSA